MLQIALQYTLPRLQATVIKEDPKDEPLFIEVLERKPDSDEEVCKDFDKESSDIKSKTLAIKFSFKFKILELFVYSIYF